MSQDEMTDAPTPPVAPMTKGKRQAALGFIFATALMDVISLGIMIPVLPNLVKEMAGGTTSQAAVWTTAFATVWGVSQFFFSPILGLLSDRYGRRPVILISIFGLGIDYIFMALAPTLWWLFLGRMIHGATAASFATAGAYIADITPPEDRAKRFGLMGAAWGIGFVIGPAVGGVLGDIDLRLPFYVAAGLALTNWLYGLLILPESLPPEKRAKTYNWAKANPLGSLKLLNSHPELFGLAAVALAFQFGHMVYPNAFVLMSGEKFGWSPLEVGVMMAASGVSTIIVQGFIVGRAVKRFGERTCMITGLAFGTVGMLIYALATNEVLFWLGIPFNALLGLVMPSVQALMTRRVAPHEQGQLQGALSAMTGLTAVIAPLTYGPLLVYATRPDATLYLPGLPFVLAAIIVLAGLVAATRIAATPGQTAPR